MPSPIPAPDASSQPPQPRPPGASGQRCARWRGCQARPSRGGLSQPPNYAAEPGRPAPPPPQLSPGCPRAGRRLPAPAGREEAAEARCGSTWAGRRRRARRFRSCALPALPAYRCGGRGAPAGVTAPPAWQPSGQPAGSRKEEAASLGPTVWTARAWQRETPTPRRPFRPPPELRCPCARRVPGAAGGLAASTERVWEDRLRQGRGFSVLFRVNFQSAKCWSLVSAPWISLPRVGVLKETRSR